MVARLQQPAGYEAGTAILRISGKTFATIEDAQLAIVQISSPERYLDASNQQNPWGTSPYRFNALNPRMEGTDAIFDLDHGITHHLIPNQPYKLMIVTSGTHEIEDRFSGIALRKPSAPPAGWTPPVLKTAALLPQPDQIVAASPPEPEPIPAPPVPLAPPVVAPIPMAPPVPRLTAASLAALDKPQRGGKGLWIAAAILLSALAAIGGWWFLFKSGEAPPGVPVPTSPKDSAKQGENAAKQAAEAAATAAAIKKAEEEALVKKTADEALARKREEEAASAKKTADEVAAKKIANDAAARKAEAGEKDRIAKAVAAALEEQRKKAEAAAGAVVPPPPLPLPLPPPPEPTHKTPEELCADRPNFISRNMCIDRDCRRPEHVNTAYCKGRAAAQQNNVPGGGGGQ